MSLRQTALDPWPEGSRVDVRFAAPLAGLGIVVPRRTETAVHPRAMSKDSYQDQDRGRHIPAIIVTKDHSGLAIAYGLATKDVPVVVFDYGSQTLGASKYVRDSIDVPDPVRSENEFVDSLRHASAYHGGLLIPATDEALVAISRHKAQLDEHYMVACPEWHITELYIDKARTYDLAEQIGVPAPRTLHATSLEDIAANEDRISYPCLVKPNQGHLFTERFGKKMFLVDDIDELLAKFDMAIEAGLDVMIQEFIPGEDSAGVNYNSFVVDEDESPIEFTARKVRNSPPKTGSPRVVISEWIPDIIEPGRRLLKHLGYRGFSCMEFKKDPRDEVYKLMEVNGRHNRSAMLAIRCGLNFPWIEYAHRVLGESAEGPTTFEEGVYWIDLLSDLKHSLVHMSDERYSPRDYLRPYLKPHVFSVFALSDIKPFVRRVAAKGRKKRHKRLKSHHS